MFCWDSFQPRPSRLMYYLVMPPLPSEPEQLFVLPGHKVDGSVL